MKACTFFGHRDCPESIKPALYETVEALVKDGGVRQFYVGHQGQFDTYVREAVSAVRKRYPIVCLTVVISYLPRSAEWENTVDTLYPEGMETVPLRYAIDRRNRWMLSRADVVVSYIRYRTGGAVRYVKMAKRQGKPIVAL